MSISFTCDFCSRKYRVDDGLAGRSVKCKECGTDLKIPSPAQAVGVAAKSAPPKDLYGIDDEDEAPLPPPRRPGMPSNDFEPRKAKKKKSGGEGHEGFRSWGIKLLVAGAAVFILPFVGLQIKGIHLMPPEGQVAIGFIMLVCGAFCLMAGSTGFLKALGFTFLGAVVGVPVLLLMVGMMLRNAGNNPNQAPAPQWAAPPNNQFAFKPPPAPNVPVPLAPAGPGPADEAPANPPAEPSMTRIVIKEAKAWSTGVPGVTFQIDYRVEARAAGSRNFDLWIKSSRGNTKIFPPVPITHDEGRHTVGVSSIDRSDAPFEVWLEGRIPGGQTQPVSDKVAASWTDPPAQNDNPRPPGFGPNPGNFPRPPGMPRAPRLGRMPR